MEIKKRLASISLFRELYTSRKNNSYAVLAELIKYGLHKSSCYQSNIEGIRNILLEYYDFEIPAAVIEYTLKKVLCLIPADGIYIFDLSKVDNIVIESGLKLRRLQYDEILDCLYKYIAKYLGRDLTDDDKEEIVKSFCSYLLDESEGNGYSNLISRYILENSSDTNLMNSLNSIKEGVVLYTGLRYSSQELGENGWKKPLVFYLDTEVLFFAGGYNGELSKTIFDDFHKLVREINKGNKKVPLIQLKYFESTKDEIIRYFEKAKDIINKCALPIPGKTAMQQIIKGKDKAYQIKEEYAKFSEYIKSLGIELDNRDSYYADENIAYNIESQELKDVLSSEFGKDISIDLQQLNFINILRRGNNSTFIDNTKYWLITGNGNVLKMGSDERLIGRGNTTFLATTLMFFTNKFWFAQNKGFGANNDFPSSFNVISKAQLAISAYVNNSLTEHYEELKRKSEEGKLNESESIAVYAELKRCENNAISSDGNDLVSSLNFVDSFNFEKILNEQELLKKRAEIAEGKNRHYEEQSQVTSNKINALETQVWNLTKFIDEQNKLNQIQEERKMARKRKIRRYTRLFLFIICALVVGSIGWVLWYYCSEVFSYIWGGLVVIGTILGILGYFSIGPKAIVNFFKS